MDKDLSSNIGPVSGFGISWHRLGNLLAQHGIIDVAAIDDPYGYDDGKTMAAIGRVAAALRAP